MDEGKGSHKCTWRTCMCAVTRGLVVAAVLRVGRLWGMENKREKKREGKELFSHSSLRQIESAERAAVAVQNKVSSEVLPIRAYLDQTVAPLLLQGMDALVRER
mmetsp:Transcript_38651/g.99254  ORF Transcript_38651/g.99254 Transcript_38651/m.99254 type:complete len:104 (-) Transcript_38651:333-644(-)